MPVGVRSAMMRVARPSGLTTSVASLLRPKPKSSAQALVSSVRSNVPPMVWPTTTPRHGAPMALYCFRIVLFAAENSRVVPVCAAIEAEMGDMEDEDKAVFLADMGMTEPGLNRVIRAAYTLLGLQTYFTCGPKEVRAWTVRVGATAPQAAAVIHTDFEKGFIRAETIAYDDFIACKGESGAKEKGKMRLEGKDYVVHDGDVLHFRFNV